MGLSKGAKRVSSDVCLLRDIYSEATINSILDYAINRGCEICFMNRLTSMLQPLTFVQLAGIQKFRGVNILLETGQTYEIGLESERLGPGSYQEIYFYDLLVDKKNLDLIKMEFGDEKNN
jgi:hypothetical protein